MLFEAFPENSFQKHFPENFVFKLFPFGKGIGHAVYYLVYTKNEIKCIQIKSFAKGYIQQKWLEIFKNFRRNALLSRMSRPTKEAFLVNTLFPPILPTFEYLKASYFSSLFIKALVHLSNPL